MKSFIDFIPLLVFFSAYYGAREWPDLAGSMLHPLLAAVGFGATLPTDQVPILVATTFAMFATIGQVALLLLLGHKVQKILWISLIIIILMGAATLYFHDPAIIKWRPTVLDWIFALTFLVSERVFGKNLIRAMAGGQIQLPDPIWHRLNFFWVAFFAFSGLLNLYVAGNYSEQIWVNFNMFGGIGLMLLFLLGQGFYLVRHIESPAQHKQ